MNEIRQDELMEPVTIANREQPPDSLRSWDLVGILGVVSRQTKTIVATVLVVLCIATLLSLFLPREYTATALVVVDARESQLLGIDTAGIDAAPATSVIETEAEIARSDEVMAKVVYKLSLSTDPEFRARQPVLARIANWVLGPPNSGTSGSDNDGSRAEMNLAGVIKRLDRAVDIRRRGVTNIISISAQTTSPRKSALIANTIAEAYLEHQANSKVEATRSAAQSLSLQVDELAAKLHSIEGEIDRIATTQADKLASSEAKQQFANMRERLDREIHGESASGANSQAQAGQPKIGPLPGDLQSSVNADRLPNDVLAEFFRLQSEARTTRALYEATLSRMTRLEHETNFVVADSRTVARAIVPNEASFPPLELIAAGSIIFALASGIALAFLREYILGGFTSILQIQAQIKLPVVSVVPYRKTKAGALAELISLEPLSPIAEAIRRTRLGIETILEFPAKLSILVTSTLPQEGKTTISIALAESFAIAGYNTLLIDGDLINPSIARALGQKGYRGLLDVLANEADLWDVVVRYEAHNINNLSILFGSSTPPVAADTLIASDRFGALMEAARDTYDVVIVDTPPIGVSVDARLVSRYVEAAVYVVRWAYANQVEVQMAIKELMTVKGLRAAIVLNGSKEAGGAGYSYARYSSAA